MDKAGDFIRMVEGSSRTSLLLFFHTSKRPDLGAGPNPNARPQLDDIGHGPRFYFPWKTFRCRIKNFAA